MLREGAISPVELVKAHLGQIERLNPSLNAFAAVLAESALVEARARKHARLGGEAMGLLDGVPVTIKDSFDVAGLPTLAGSRLRSGNRAAEDATVVARLRREGAILLGKTNTPELLASYETDNLITGRTNNPWNVERTPGGSSGGEGAAIAAFCSAGGVASDGGGSIRVPAHFCGIAGLKPTPGRVPGTGHFPSMGYPGGLIGVAGPMARTAEDLRLLFAALAGYDGQDPFSAPVPLRPAQVQGVRIGVWEQFYRVPVDPEIRAAVRRAAAMLEALGMGVEDFEPRGLERAPNIWAVFSRWPSAATKALLEARKAQAHWTLLEWLGSEPPTAEQVLINLASRDRMRASLLRQMESVAARADAGVRGHGVPAQAAKVGIRGPGDRVVSGHDAGGSGQRIGAAGGDHSGGSFTGGPAHRGAVGGPAVRRRVVAGAGGAAFAILAHFDDVSLPSIPSSSLFQDQTLAVIKRCSSVRFPEAGPLEHDCKCALHAVKCVIQAIEKPFQPCRNVRAFLIYVCFLPP